MPVVDNPRTTISMLANSELEGDLEDAVSQLVFQLAYSWSYGGGDQQFELVYSDTRTVADFSTQSFSLTNGSVTNVLGEAIEFGKVKGLWVRSRAPDPDTRLQLLRATATDNWLSTISLGDPLVDIYGGYEEGVNPGGMFMTIAPNTGFDMTVLAFVNSGNGVDITYDIIVWGTTPGS